MMTRKELDLWVGIFAVIGIGEDGLAGLSAAARTLVETAETLVGGERHLAMVPPGAAERLLWARPLTDTIGAIAARRRRQAPAQGRFAQNGTGGDRIRHPPAGPPAGSARPATG